MNDMKQSMFRSRKILTTIRQHDEKHVVIVKTIYTVCKKYKLHKKAGR